MQYTGARKYQNRMDIEVKGGTNSVMRFGARGKRMEIGVMLGEWRMV